MFLEKGSLTGKRNKVLVGYDLGDNTSQISYCYMDESEPETVCVVTGTQQFNFPTVLGKRHEVNQWVYGKEAFKLVDSGKGILVEKLLSLAKEGNEVVLGEDSFDPVSLLALFMKRSLALLGMAALPDQIEGIMITVEDLDHRTIEVLLEAASIMQIKTENIFFQSHVESFFEYVAHQPEEIRKGSALLMDYKKDGLFSYKLECNRHTTPIVAFADEKKYPEMRQEDAQFGAVLEELCSGSSISTAYLVGSGFDGEWYGNSLRYLCRDRRVFRGNNLYSKGACYGIREKFLNDRQVRKMVFLGRDKLKTNLGMKVMRRGKEIYYTLLDAGISWFEAKKECEFILEDGNSFSILMTSLTGNETREIEIVLNDMPHRRERATRVCMKLTLRSERQALVVLEDLGFGEIYPATHKIWEEEIEL